MRRVFSCDKCGECCRNLFGSEIYAPLDRGDGICRYLSGNLCSIYQDRPLLCRIDECYEKFFKGQLSLEEYYRMNKSSCEKLKTGRKVEEYGKMGNRRDG